MNEFIILFAACLLFFIGNGDCNEDCVTQEYDIQSRIMKSGDNFYELCCSNEKNAKLQWVDNQQQEVTFGPGTASNVYTEKNDEGINLFINQLIKGTYNYTCVAEINGKNSTILYVIEVFDAPFIFNTEENQSIIKGTDDVILCSVSPLNDSNINTEWYREKYEEIQIVENDKYKISELSGLNIKNVDDNDAGIYKCRASHYKTGYMVDKTIYVEVVTLPVIQSLKVSPATVLKEGDSLTIECIAQGYPHPTYTWQKISNDLKVNSSLSSKWTQHVNTITIENIDRDDRGIYECTASNVGGSVKNNVLIEVLFAPKIIEFDNKTFDEGLIAQVACKAIGRPAPELQFVTKFKSPSPESEPEFTWNSTETETTMLMTFINVSRINDGFYSCYANNSIDSVYEERYVQVRHKSNIIGPHTEIVWGWNDKTLNLTCENESNPPAAITWNFIGNNSAKDDPILIAEIVKNLSINLDYATITISNNAYYGIYECIVGNEIGNDTKIFHLKRAFIPGPINNAEVIEIKPTSVIFNIIGPNDSKITGYMAQYDILDNYNITNIHVNRTWSIDRPYRIDKLKPNTTYSVRFAAKNELGDGDWSDYIEFNTSESTAPEKPLWNHGSLESAELRDNLEATTIKLKWTEPENNGNLIDYYIIKYCALIQEDVELNESTVCEDLILQKNEITLDNLKPNTTYSIYLLAHNSVGNSSFTSINITTAALNYNQPTSLLSAGAIIAISVITVFICLLILDIILFLWQKKGIIASCFQKKKKEDNFNSRDNKGLLKHSRESDDTMKRPDNRQKQPEYKSTGVITGKHSAV